MAVLASVVANSQRGKGRMSTPSDFLPKWDGKRHVMTPEEMFAAAMQANVAMGGTAHNRT